MIQQDYLLRMIEQAAAVLRQIIQKRNDGRYEDAAAEVRVACQRFIGLDFDFLKDLHPDALIDLLRLGGTLDLGKAHVLAELLKEEAEIAAFQGNFFGATHRFTNALCCYTQVVPHLAGKGREEAVNTVDVILGKLTDQPLTATARRFLFPYYEHIGRFAMAEDLLFDLLEEADADLPAEGGRFYRRLLQSSDDLLQKGNLPREEVEQGWAEFQARTAPTPEGQPAPGETGKT